MSNEGNNKIIRGESKPIYNLDYNKNVEVGEVISIDDPNYLGRIKVRIKGSASNGGDDGILDSDLPWAFPMIPKFLSTQPKVKEAVFIFTFSKNKEHTDRLYLGPIISQPQQLNFDPFYYSALRGFSFGSEYPDVDVTTIPEIKGVFPDPQDVSIQGRYNTDITQKNNEIILRAGKFEIVTPNKNNPLPFKFNAKTQGYIQIKNDTIIVKGTDNIKEEKGSVTNIISNKINLITHKGGSPSFNVTNQDDLISDDELLNIINNGHPLGFGDIQLQYFRLIKDAIIGHVHNGHGNPATDLTGSGNKQALANFKSKADALESQMLSTNIRIN
jgi:hypothetical protein